MTLHRVLVMCVAFFSTSCFLKASAQEASVLRAGNVVTFGEMVADLAKADVVCIGEQHGHEAGHAFEARLLEAVGQASPRAGLSMEMFEQDVQVVLDEYLKGYITEAAFLAASRPWPRYKTDYRPMVEWCKANRRPVVAANVPRRYVNMVSRLGQACLLALPRTSRSYLPRLPYSMDISPEYERALDGLFGAPHGGPAATGMPSPDNMKAAQGLWDQGMADSILQASRRGRLRPVVHVTGSMHCERGFGIVERLRRAAPRLRIVTVVIRPTPSGGAPLSPDLGDYVVTCGEPRPAAPGAE